MIDIAGFTELEEGREPDLSALVAACAAHDGGAFLEMEKKLNAHQAMRNLFLAYEGARLAGALSVFAPKSDEAELGALVLPEQRRRGIFGRLLAEAEGELIGFGYRDELFVVDGRSEAGKAAAARLGARYEYTEYAMRYAGAMPMAEPRVGAAEPGIELRRVGIEMLGELVSLRAGAFGDSLEDAESFERATFASSARQSYAAFLDGRMVGACSLGFEGGSVSINGLVVEEASRGKGYGQAILASVLGILWGRGLEIVLDVDSFNANARHIYEKAGFESDRAVEYYRRAIPGKTKPAG
jgi:predicted GNAT family acetyltransferase